MLAIPVLILPDEARQPRSRPSHSICSLTPVAWRLLSACYNPSVNDLPEAVAVSPAEEAPAAAEPATPGTRHLISPLAAFSTLTFLAGLALGFVIWGGGAAPASPAPPAEERVPVDVDDDPALGPADAPVTMIEFSDFACPYCRKFQEETFPALWQAYPDQLRFVYRDYPILSPESDAAAEAAQCADEQGAFWPYHDALFQAQFGLSHDAYLAYAQILELDTERFSACIEDHRYQAEVEADARDAAAWGVNGTPTFFINGIRLVGAQPYSEFARVIDAELGR